MANTSNENDEEILDADLGDEESDDAILEIAKARFRLAEEAETDIRRQALDDLRFRAGDQWPDDVKVARDSDKRPCLTINRLPQFVRQITNDQRQNPTGIKVNAVDDAADVETAKILQGLIRHIEYASSADTAYDTAFESAVANSFGYFRIVTDYADPKSFDQEIFVKRIRDPFTVYLDPNAQEPDGSDAHWGFVIDTMSKEEFKNQFGDSKLSKMEDWDSLGSKSPGWATKDSCRIAEYFYKTFKKDTLVQLNDGSSWLKSEIPMELPQGIEVVAERETSIATVQWCKINGVEILEKTDWPGQWIPIVPVYGDELMIDGKRVLESVIRHAKDPQRMYNYWASSETETIALAPRAPFIGVEGQFEGHEAQWKTANTKNHAFLEYKPKSIGGVPVPAPARNVYEPPVQAITQARMQSAEDLKATTGIYDASLGNRSNEQSGVAIQRRNNQSEVSNFHFVDNLNRSIRHGGRIIIDLIPKIYDTPRAARILQEDGTAEMVQLNQIFQKNGQPMKYDLQAGKYDVAVTTGPNFATRRQESVAAMIDLTKSYPPIMQTAGDLLVRNMDWPGATEIADRLKKSLPPALQDDPNDKNHPLPPQVKAQMAQMSATIQQLSQHLNEATDEIKKKKFEIESRERIEMRKLEVASTIELANLNHKDGAMLLEHQVGAVQHRLDLLNDQTPIMDQNLGAAANPGLAPQQQPTGGQSPGSPMGV